jgi:molybdopterin-guanine dinucleotide biosynthesis protein B
LILALKEKGYRAVSVKNIHIENFSIDTEKKDTWRHSRAGSEAVVARSENETAFIVSRRMIPIEVLEVLNRIAGPDIVLVEGYWEDDSSKIAVGDIEDRPNTKFRYKDNFDEILNYTVEGVEIEKVLGKLPGLDCGKCGKETCKELAKGIRVDDNTFKECHYFSEKKISLEVDGKEIPLGQFAKDIVSGTITGMVSTLKGVDKGKQIKIEIEG